MEEKKKLKMTKKRFMVYFRDFWIIIFGTTIVSFAVKYIFDPAGMVTGGVSGLAIVIKHISKNLLGIIWTKRKNTQKIGILMLQKL